MQNKITLLIICIGLLSGCIQKPVKNSVFQLKDHAFLQANTSTSAVILCHGRGKHPHWLVVDPLRKAIHQQLNYHTLSLQMPKGDIPWKDYQHLFPEAFNTLKNSINYLKTEHKVKKIFLIGHSMGSRMGSAFLSTNPEAGIVGFIGIGMRNNGDHPLDAQENLTSVKIPVLDLFGNGGSRKDANHAKARESLISNTYQQIMIENANHKFTLHEKEMIDTVINWLELNQN